MSTLVARINSELQGDRAVWAIFAVLAVFSLLAVYSSSGILAYRDMGGNTEAYLIKHGLILLMGMVLTYIFHLFHYMKFNRWAPAMLVLCVPLLVYTIAYGAEINDARRWIELPFVGLTFQTSDFAELALITYVARAISAKQDYIKDFNGAFLPIIVPILIICGLIAPSDLSSSVVLFFTCVCMMFVGRVALQYIGLLLLLGGVVFALLLFIGMTFPDVVRWETWSSRLNEFITQEDGGYQVVQAKIAIANGEWFGLGPGNSIQRNYLPSPYADFIYAIICEEYGIAGGVVIMGLYVLLFFRVVRLVTKSPKSFGAMLAIGISVSLIVQAFTNIAVSVHLVPVTGITLPLISKGGTSIVFTCISFGMLLSVSKFVESVSKT
jgi:cell division protein FtsW